jgi:hypothetical protein
VGARRWLKRQSSSRVPATPALRREQIKLRVSLSNALMHTKGYAAPETKASLECFHTARCQDVTGITFSRNRG